MPPRHAAAPTVTEETLTLARVSSGVVKAASRTVDAQGELVRLGLIAEGGMGVVLLARQNSLSREVAVKTTKVDASDDDVAALVREAMVTGSLEHPSIVPVHALAEDEDGRPLLVMKRVEGVSWLTLLRDPLHPAWKTHLGEGGDTLGANLDVLISICRALELAHLRGILHCDIKPSNVMLGRFGEVYLVDWGLATTIGTVAEATVGTPSYMAPEMVGGEVLDERTDVYLLGATLHRVLTGRARHSGMAVADTLVSASVSAPFAYSDLVPAPLAELCNTACAASKDERVPSVAAFRALLVEFKRRRSALAICAVASKRLAQLEGLLSEPSDLALAYRLATEARFGFAQSLAQCPDLAEANSGAARSLEALVNLELSQGHLDTAEALLEEASLESIELLRARLDYVRRASAARVLEQQQLRTLAFDLDPTIGRRSRFFVMLLLLLIQVVLIPLVSTQTVFGFAMIALTFLVATSLCALVLRRRLLANMFSRRIVGLLVLCEVAVVCNRLIGAHRHQSMTFVVTTDMLLCAVTVTVAAVLMPRLAAVLPILAVAIVTCELRPEWSPNICPWSFALLLGVAAWALNHRRAARA